MATSMLRKGKRALPWQCDDELGVKKIGIELLMEDVNNNTKGTSVGGNIVGEEAFANGGFDRWTRGSGTQPAAPSIFAPFENGFQWIWRITRRMRGVRTT